MISQEPLKDTITIDGLENACRRFYSFYRGFVTSVNDPASQGRIKVLVPVIADRELGDYAVPISCFAGNGFGIFFIPRVGDEVYVAFEHGDIQSPFYIGGWWGDPTGGAPELPAEIFNRLNPTSTRLIKTPAGHALIFEDGGVRGRIVNKRVELRTADQTYPVDAEPETTVRHQLIMSDQEERIELSTAGEDQANPGVNFHILEMHDLQKTVTLRTGQNHLIELDGTPDAEKITIKSRAGATIIIDDTVAAPKITISTVAGNTVVLDDTPGAENVDIQTVGGRQVLLDDTPPGLITIQDPEGNIVEMSPVTGIAVTSVSLVNINAAGACNITAAGAVNTSAAGIADNSTGGPMTSFSTGTVASLFLGVMASIIIGAVTTLLVGGATLICGAPLVVLATSIALGSGTTQALLLKTFLIWVKTHTHPVTTAPGTTGVPLQAALLEDGPNAVYLTQNLAAS